MVNKKIPIFIKMDKAIHDDMLDYITQARKLNLKSLDSKKEVIDAAVRSFMETHPINVTKHPVYVEGVTDLERYKEI